VQAYFWCNLAASLIGGFFPVEKTRDELEESMTPEQILEAQRLARDWKPKNE
jgi:hypothetical protein